MSWVTTKAPTVGVRRPGMTYLVEAWSFIVRLSDLINSASHGRDRTWWLKYGIRLKSDTLTCFTIYETKTIPALTSWSERSKFSMSEYSAQVFEQMCWGEAQA